MPVRVLIRLRTLKGLKANRKIDTAALLNTGYTGSSPEIIIPTRLAEEIGLWPPPSDAIESTYDTAGGPARFQMIKDAAALQVINDGIESRELTINISISPTEREALLSDVVIGELEIVILNAHKGYWKFRSDSIETSRCSRKAELW